MSFSVMKRKNKSKTQKRPYEVEQLCKDGSTVWTEVIIKILFDNKGKKVAY